MTEYLKVEHASVAVEGAETCVFLQRLLEVTEPAKATDSPDLRLFTSPQGLRLSWWPEGGQPLHYHLDFGKHIARLRSYPAPKQGAFNQALGKRTKQVVDATGGWGGDALLMNLQGYDVTVIERNPILASLLAEAFERLSREVQALQHSLTTPSVIMADAIDELEPTRHPADCVYLDPMFPAKRKKSAAANKEMTLLQWLLGYDHSAFRLVNTALHNGYPRVVVKRPDHALPLIEHPNERFSSKLVHYDVYLRNR